MKQVKQNPRGRPTTSLVDRLRVILWSHYVMHEGRKFKQATSFEEYLYRRFEISMARGLWTRYQRGEILPHGSLVDPKNSLVGELAQHFIGSNHLFEHPIWTLLNLDEEPNLRRLCDMYFEVDRNALVHLIDEDFYYDQFYVFDDDDDDDDIDEKPHQHFWHMELPTEKLEVIVEKIDNPVGKLFVCLLEARMAYLGQRLKGFVEAQLLAASAARGLSDIDYIPQPTRETVVLMAEALCLDAAYSKAIEGAENSERHMPFFEPIDHAIQLWQLRAMKHISNVDTRTSQRFVKYLRAGSGLGKRTPFEQLLMF